MASAGDEDLVASKTDGFKVGEKKTVEEYAKLGEPFPTAPHPWFAVVSFRWLLRGTLMLLLHPACVC